MTGHLAIELLQYGLMLSWVTLLSHAGWAIANLRPPLFAGQGRLALMLFLINCEIGLFRFLLLWGEF